MYDQPIRDVMDTAKVLRVPPTMTVAQAAREMARVGIGAVLVMQDAALIGIFTERDLLEAITGEFGGETDDNAWAVQRADGSWLMDGLIPVPELKDRLGLREMPDEDRGRYNTLAGMVMLLLGRLPQTADAVQWEGWRFEVVDLDGKRVDKVLVTAIDNPGETT